MVLKAGETNIPWRRVANQADEGKRCLICGEPFRFGSAIAFTLTGRPIHIYRCWKWHIAALTRYYNMDVPEIVRYMKVSPRTAFRIRRLANLIGAM